MKKNTIGKKIGVFAIVTAMMLGTAACGSDVSSDKKKKSNEQRNMFAAETTTAAFNVDEDYEPSESFDEESAKVSGMASNQAMGDEAVTEAPAPEEKSGNENENTSATLQKIDTEKLVYQCNLSFETTEYDASVQKLQNLIRQYGGFLEYENVSEYDDYAGDRKTKGKRYIYNATVRIPSGSYESFVNGTEDLGDLKSKNHNVQNFSSEYTDLSAQLEVLEAKHASYIEMMKEAKSLNDMESLLMVDDRITDVEIEINRIKSRMNNINNDVAYSYVYVNIAEVKEYEEVVEDPETFGERVSQGLKDGWKRFKEGVQDFVVDCSENLPRIIIAIVIIVLCYIFIIRKLLRLAGVPTGKERKAKKAAKKAAKQEAKQTEKQDESKEAPAQEEKTE